MSTREGRAAIRAPARTATRRKRPFDIDEVMARIRSTIAERGVADAAMFALASEGYTSLFELLVACVISIRTFDETMLVCARRLFARAGTPAAIAALPAARVPVFRNLRRSIRLSLMVECLADIAYDGSAPDYRSRQARPPLPCIIRAISRKTCRPP